MLKKLSIALPLMMASTVAFGANDLVVKETLQEIRDTVHGVISTEVEKQTVTLKVVAVPVVDYNQMAEIACGIVIKHDVDVWEYIEIRDVTPDAEEPNKVIGKFDCLLVD